MLLDQYERPIRQNTPTTDEIATVEKDIDIFAGWLKRLENPDPVLRTEAAGRGLRLYDEVNRDAHAGSVLQQRILAVVGKEWEIIPAKSARKMGRPASTTQEQVVADFVSNVLENCNFDQARQELLKAILYGHYEAEVLWQKRIGNAIGIKKIIGKHPRRFIFTTNRELRLLTPQNMIDGEAVPNRKFIIYTYGDSDNPYGCGLGQRLWWPVWFKKNGVQFWLIFLEKFGMPTVVGKYPPGTLEPKQKELMNAINSIQSDTGIKIPDSMDISFLEASRSGRVTHEQLCEYMDRQISKAVLGQTASTEGAPGKLGNDKEQGDVRQEIIEADADLLDGCLNDSLIKWIVDYNFPGVTAYPKILTYAAAKPDLVAQKDIDKTLTVDIGLPIGIDYFYKTYGIPKPAEGEELVSVPRKAAIPGLDATFSESADPTEAWIEYYLEKLKPVLQKSRESALADIEKWLQSRTSIPSEEEFISGVEEVLGEAATNAIGDKIITDTVTKIYTAFRKVPGVNLGFGGPDVRAVNFLGKLDHFYTSSYLKNPDAQSVMRNFIRERYLEKGGGLFGRGNPADIAEFKNLLGQKVADLEDWQIRRIVDTSVQRTRNWASVAQMHEAAIEEIEIYEPLHECSFCVFMNGKIISVAVAYKNMERQMDMTPDEYEADIKATNMEMNRAAQSVDRADYAASAGMLPPYHPFCRGLAIRRVK